ncbi:hypothetical protein [Candidatus Nitrospira bockiana]
MTKYKKHLLPGLTLVWWKEGDWYCGELKGLEGVAIFGQERTLRRLQENIAAGIREELKGKRKMRKAG